MNETLDSWKKLVETNKNRLTLPSGIKDVRNPLETLGSQNILKI